MWKDMNRPEGRPVVHIEGRRKDGKHRVLFCFAAKRVGKLMLPADIWNIDANRYNVIGAYHLTYFALTGENPDGHYFHRNIVHQGRFRE